MQYLKMPDGQLISVPDDITDEEMDQVASEFVESQALDVTGQEEDPFADDRTVLGQAFETAKAIPRGFANTFLSSGEGIGELADAVTNKLGFEDLIDDGEDNELVRLSRQGQESVERALGADEAYRNTWFTGLGEALGSFAGFATPVGAGSLLAARGLGVAGKAASLAGVGVAAGSGASNQAQRVQAARDQGIEVSEDQEDVSTLFGGGIGLLELVSPTGLFNRIPKNANPEFVSSMYQRILSAAKTGGVEAVQEVASELAQDAVERGIYNENLASDMSISSLITSDEFTLGGATGFIADFALNSALNRRGKIANEAKINKEVEERARFDARVADGEQAVSDFQELEAQGIEASKGVQSLAQSLNLPDASIIAPPTEGLTDNPVNDYANHIQGTLNEDFPSSGKFEIEFIKGEPQPSTPVSYEEGIAQGVTLNPDGSIASQDGDTPQVRDAQAVPRIVHVSDPDSDGNVETTVISGNLSTPEEAGTMRSILNERIDDKKTREAVTETVARQGGDLTGDQKKNLVSWGQKALYPRENEHTALDVNRALDTINPADGYIEILSPEDVISTSDLKMTAAQKIASDLDLKNKQSFTTAQIREVFPDADLSKLLNDPEKITYTVETTSKSKGKDGKFSGSDTVSVIGKNAEGVVVDRKSGSPYSEEEMTVRRQRQRNAKKTRPFSPQGRRGKKETPQEKNARLAENKTRKNNAINFANELNRANEGKFVIEEADTSVKKEAVAKGILESLNVTNDINSPEIGVYLNNAIGSEAGAVGSMKNSDFTLAMKKLQSLPRFSIPTQVPLFGFKDTSPIISPSQQAVIEDIAPDARVNQLLGQDNPIQSSLAPVEPDAPIENILDPEAVLDINKLQASLRKKLDKYGLKDIGINISESLQRASRNKDGDLVFGVKTEKKDGIVVASREQPDVDEDALAFFDPMTSTIMFGLDKVSGAVEYVTGKSAQGATKQQKEDAILSVLDHEMMHAMRRLDLFTPKEWQTLSNQASIKVSSRGKTFLEQAKITYKNASSDLQMEEAVVELFRESRVNPKLLTGKPRTLLNRMIDFLYNVREAITGTGNQSFDQLIRNIESGQIGARERFDPKKGNIRSTVYTDIIESGKTKRQQQESGDLASKGQEGQSLGDFEGVDKIAEARLDRSLQPRQVDLEEVPMGINVATDGDTNYANLIVSGQKQYESRQTDSLRPYVGKRVGIVETKSGQKAQLVGYATIGEPQLVGQQEFESSRDLHLVPEGSKFDIKSGQQKFLYEMIDPSKLNDPIDASGSKGIVARNISAISGLGGERKTGQLEADEFLSKGSQSRDRITDISEEKIDEVVRKNLSVAENISGGAIPEYSVKAEPRAQYIAQNPDEAAEFLAKPMYSRQREPEYDIRAKDELDRLVNAPIPDKTAFDTYLETTSQTSFGVMMERFKMATLNNWTRLEKLYTGDGPMAGILADSGAWQAAMMADRSKGFMAEAIREGTPSYVNGAFKVEPFSHNGKPYRGLIGVMDQLFNNQYNVNLEKLAQAYSVAMRSANDLIGDKLSPANAQSLANLQPEIEKYINPETGRPIVIEWHEAWTAYNNKTVEFLIKTGVLDSTTGEIWKDSAFVPFYREAEDMGGKDPVPSTFAGFTSEKSFKEYKGSEKQVTVPLLEAITKNLGAAVDMGMKNVAQQRIVRDMVKLGLAEEVKVNAKTGNAIGSSAALPNQVTFKVDGQTRKFSIKDPLIFESMSSLGGGELNGLLTSIVSFPSTVLRETITRTPSFMIVNMMRDTISAFVTSGSSFVPVLSTLKNFNSGIGNLSQYGVVGGYDFANDPKNIYEDFQAESRRRNKSGSLSFIHRDIWNFLGRQTTKSDAATRQAVFNDVMARTGNEAEAAFQALEVLNFSRRGSHPAVRFITAAIPFLNARFQGLDVLYRSGVSGRYSSRSDKSVNERRFQFMMRGLTLTALSALYYTSVSDDDQYKEALEYEKDLFFIIPNPFSPKNPLKIPIPFEIGLIFKTIPERILSYRDGSTSGRELKDSFQRNLTSTLEVNPMGIAAISPLYEAMVNKNTFTGQAIVPVYLTDKNSQEAFQQRAGTNQLAIELGKILNMSPLKIDHVLHGYSGTMGAYALQAIDYGLRSQAISGTDASERSTIPLHQLPFIRRFVTSEFGGGLSEDLYEAMNEVTKFTQSYDKLIIEERFDEAEKYMQGREHMFDLGDQVKDAKAEMKVFREQLIAIASMKGIDAETRREMEDNIRRSRQMYLRQESAFGGLKEQVNAPPFDFLYRSGSK